MDNPQTHVKILGWLYIALNAIMLLIGCLVAVIMVSSGAISGDSEAFAITTIVGLVVLGILFIISIPGIVTGYGLLKYQSWARILAFIVGALSVMNFPFGTALAVYTFFVLLNNDVERLFGV